MCPAIRAAVARRGNVVIPIIVDGDFRYGNVSVGRR
jgi:hypothetical protein